MIVFIILVGLETIVMFCLRDELFYQLFYVTKNVTNPWHEESKVPNGQPST